MRFLRYTGDDSWESVEKRHKEYMSYLMSKEAGFPTGAYAFATASWHYNPSDHRCPHDAWLNELRVEEKAGMPETPPFTMIRLELLGAYHNGILEIVYEKVSAYELRFVDPASAIPGRGHGDWLLDEIRLSDDGYVEHEINFSRNGNWLIKCGDISVIWTPQ